MLLQDWISKQKQVIFSQGILLGFCTSYLSSLHMFISFLFHSFSFGMEKAWRTMLSALGLQRPMLAPVILQDKELEISEIN